MRTRCSGTYQQSAAVHNLCHSTDQQGSWGYCPTDMSAQTETSSSLGAPETWPIVAEDSVAVSVIVLDFASLSSCVDIPHVQPCPSSSTR